MSGQPNILWIVTTQWRAQACGYAGDANARTPWIDGLAGAAVDYNQAVTPHPLGPQARAALLTGRLCPENGVCDYYDPLPVYAPGAEALGGLVPAGPAAPARAPAPARGRTVAHALNDRGYATGFLGKWHLSERDRAAPFVGEGHARQVVPPERRGGFGFWEGFESGFLLNDPWLHGTRLEVPRHFKGYQSDILCQRAAVWCQEQARHRVATGQPFFCLVSLESPHPPYHAPVPHAQEMAPAEIRLRGNVPTGGEVERKARDELAGYYAHIEATDRAIGRLLAEVDLQDTAVVFTSVHGDMHGSHGLFRKAWPYEESVRVPLLVSPPRSGRKPEGTRSRETVSLVDLPHMAVAWAEGREWRCRRDSAAISMPAATPIAQQCPQAWRGFRTARHKLILRREPDGQESPWLYFDLEHDPLEQRNLVGVEAHRAEIAGLAALL
jgi:arylsulfatase A-like enzyme